MKSKSYLYIVMIMLLGSVIVVSLNNNGFSETYQNLKHWSPGPSYGNNYLLEGNYPISNNPVSTKTYSHEWRNYPAFALPSYAQITNNLRYYRNPNIATSSPEDFLDTFYDNKTNQSNYIKPGKIKPIVTEGKPRVGYWNTNVDVLY